MRACRLLLLTLILVSSGRTGLSQDIQKVPLPDPCPAPYGPPPPPPHQTTETAEEPPTPEAPLVLEIVPVVDQTQRMSSRVAIVVDASGSMAGIDRIRVALEAARHILAQEADQLEVVIYAFANGQTKWPGVPHDGHGQAPPPGWTQFPSEIALRSATEWLRAQGANGGTNPEGAVMSALGEKVDDLTVVIVTDGGFSPVQFKFAVQMGQTARLQAGFGRAVVMILGVGKDADKKLHLAEVGRSERGGFYLVRELSVTEPDSGD